MALSDPTMDNAALLVIDVQDTFSASPRWAQRSNPNFEMNITELIRAFRAANRPVIFFLHSDKDPGWTTDSPHYKLMDFVGRHENEPLLHKTSRNAFTTTNLAQILQEHQAHRLVVTGIATEQCCETTARIGGDMGYDVDFVTDATLTFPIEHLSTNQIIERTELCLHGRFARIATTAEIVAQCAVLSS